MHDTEANALKSKVVPSQRQVVKARLKEELGKELTYGNFHPILPTSLSDGVVTWMQEPKGESS